MRGGYFLVFVQLLEKYGTLIQRNTALIENVPALIVQIEPTSSVEQLRQDVQRQLLYTGLIEQPSDSSAASAVALADLRLVTGLQDERGFELPPGDAAVADVLSDRSTVNVLLHQCCEVRLSALRWL
eukprot:SAG31_NODE_1153_length_9640_cov_2.830206_10_plen_127_part_00